MMHILREVLPPDMLSELQAVLLQASWQDGRATAGDMARSVKNNQQLQHPDAPVHWNCLKATASPQQLVLHALHQHPQFVAAALPKVCFPPQFARYKPGAEYGWHVDSALMDHAQLHQALRADLSCTVYLNAPTEYEGGALEIQTPNGIQSVRLNAGDAVLYEATTLHRVAPVLQGQRLVSVLWVQSLVQNPAQRAALLQLDECTRALRSMGSGSHSQALGLSQVYNNLLRSLAS